MQSISPLRRALYLYIGSVALLALSLANWQHAVLRLDSDLANAIATILAWVLPFVFFAALAPKVKGIRLGFLILVTLALMVLAIIPVSIETMDAIEIARSGRDSGFERIQTIDVADGSQLVMYRTDCGATCSYGIVLRHEARLIGPIRVVRNVWRAYPAESADVHLIDAHSLTANGERVRLLSHVVF
jgi:hypothetical protein